MDKTVIAIIFSVIYTSFTIAPSMFAIMDDTYDISILISSSEEEEKKGEEKSKDFEIEVPSPNIIDESILNKSLVSTTNFCTNNYSSLFRELTSPPPEISI